MGPYKKEQTAGAIDDGWEVADGDGNIIAILDTQLLADVVMNWLVNGGTPPPNFAEGESYGEPEEDEDEDD